MSESTLGHNFRKWLICKRQGSITEADVWAIIPPHGYVVQRGAEFATGAEAFAAFAAGGKRGLYEELTIRDRSRSKAQSRVIGGMP